MHKNLVGSFLGSAKKMLRVDGEIHVTHKTAPPYDLWDLVGLGLRNSLICIDCAEFKIENYPGYNNKRGAGSKCDEPFHLGECNTFKFIFNPSRKNMPRTKQKKPYFPAPSRKIQKALPSPQIYSSQKPISWIDNRNSPACVVNDVNGFLSYAYQNVQRVPNSISPTHSFHPVEVRRPLPHGAVMSRDVTGRPSGDYFLNELRCRSPSRFLKLQQRRHRIRLVEQYGRGDYL